MTSRIEFLDAEFTDLESPRDARTHTRLGGDVLFGSQPERPAAVNAKSTSPVTSVRPNAPLMLACIGRVCQVQCIFGWRGIYIFQEEIQ